jgi:perosamine synthetase
MLAQTFDPSAIADAIASCLPRGGAELHKPALGEAEAEAAEECVYYGIESHEPIDRAEALIAEACGTKHAIAVSSGTMALQVALQTLGVQRGDAVLVPSLTFAAVAAAVCHVGAEPVFLDSQDFDLGIAPFKLRRFLEREASELAGRVTLKRNGQRIAALIAVHLFGLPCRIRELAGIAREWRLPLIEDACEALGARDMNRPCGSFGAIGVTSFNTNKIVTSGGGGAIMTDDDALAERARHLATTARLRHAWLVEHDGIGQNARIPTLCAAVLVPQLKRLDSIIEYKRALAAAYLAALVGVPGVKLMTPREECTANHWLPVLLIDPRWTDGRDALLAALHKRGVKARAVFTPLHRLEPYAGFLRDDVTSTDSIWGRAVCLPSNSGVPR